MAPKVSDNEEEGPNDNSGDLVHRPHNNLPVAPLLRPGRHLQRRSRPEALPRGVATPEGRNPLLPDRQSDVVLRTSHDPHLPLLHPDLDQSVAEAHTLGHEGRPNGEDTAEIEGEGGENVGRGRHTVRPLVATPLRDLHCDQAGRRAKGGRDRPHSDADRPVAGCEQLVHQSDPVRLLQQKVSAGLRCNSEERPLLRQDQVLRDSGYDVLVHEHEEVLVLREQQQQQQQQLVDKKDLPRAPCPPGEQRLVHIQPHRRLKSSDHDTDLMRFHVYSWRLAARFLHSEPVRG